MKHIIAAFALCLLLNSAHAQQSGTYTTYIAGKAEVVDQWTITTEADTVKTSSSLGKPGAAPAQRAVTVAVNHRPKSFVLLAGDNEVIAADFAGTTVKVRVHGQPERELQTKATMVLENLLWHQFVFLLNQYDETKAGNRVSMRSCPASRSIIRSPSNAPERRSIKPAERPSNLFVTVSLPITC